MTPFDAAAAILTAVEDHYTAESVALPSRRYVADGAPAVDCEQVTVQVVRTFPHAGNVLESSAETLAAHAAYWMRGAEIAVTVIRCVPTPDDRGRPPSPASMTASAQTILADETMVAAAIRAWGRDVGCSSLAVTGWQALKNDGGFGGGQTRALVSLG